MMGMGLTIENDSGLDAPPPGVGFSTVTKALLAVKISVDGTVAVNCAALTKTVVKGAPFHSTSEPPTKLAPFTVTVKLAPPAVAEFGNAEASTATRLSTVKVAGLGEVPPPGAGVTTVIEIVPPLTRSPTGTKAVNCVAFTSVVTRGVPFQSTTEVLMKPVPFTVSVKPAPPAFAEVGEMEATPGMALGVTMTSTSTGEVLPAKLPSPLYTAVMECEPRASAEV
jgi:hypothetical protein